MFKSLFAIACSASYCLLAAVTAHANPPSNAATPAPNAQQRSAAIKHVWNLHDASILQVIHMVGQATGTNFIIDPRVSGKISLLANTAISNQDIYAVFLSILATLGYKAVTVSPHTVKIAPINEPDDLMPPLQQDHSTSNPISVHLLSLQAMDAGQLLQILQPLLPNGVKIAACPPGNILIITGYGPQITNLSTLISAIESRAHHGVSAVHLQHTSALYVARILNKLHNTSNELPLVASVADPRVNNILLYGYADARSKMQAIIKALDKPSKMPSTYQAILKLHYLAAEKLAPILNKLAQDMNLTAKDKLSDEGAIQNVDSFQVHPEAISNSLLINAATTAMLNRCTAMVRTLDQQPRQVLITAIIAEIDAAQWQNLGIQWGTVANNQQVSPGDGELSTGFPILGAGNLGIIPQMPLRTVLSMLHHLHGVNILATPNIMVLDKHHASIAVGQDVPQQHSAWHNTLNTTGPITNFNSRRVALQLAVQPSITPKQTVLLAINIKNDSLENPDNPGLNPLINISQINNQVMVKNGHILVIGGLISKNYHVHINKLPILGDIPIINILFRHKMHVLEKKLLLIFIKPQIMAT